MSLQTDLAQYLEDQEGSPGANAEAELRTTNELYKKWYRSGSGGGFLAVTTWREAAMLAADIGEVAGGKLTGNTKVWVGAFELATYLKSALSTTYHDVAYPGNERINLQPGDFIRFGGAVVDAKPISRVLKIERGRLEVGVDPKVFIWKCGHFVARRTDSGAFIPDMKQALHQHSIRLTRVETLELETRLGVALAGWAAADPDWITAINSRERG